MTSMSEMELKRNATEKIYHVPGCRDYQHRKRNVIFFGSGSIKHEMAKALGGLMLSRWGDVKFSPEVVKKLQELQVAVNSAMLDFPSNKTEYITECVPNANPKRRVDLLCLDNNVRFEFETDHKIEKDKGDPNTITIYI